jgi:hypothetical protein
MIRENRKGFGWWKWGGCSFYVWVLEDSVLVSHFYKKCRIPAQNKIILRIGVGAVASHRKKEICLH